MAEDNTKPAASDYIKPDRPHDTFMLKEDTFYLLQESFYRIITNPKQWENENPN